MALSEHAGRNGVASNKQTTPPGSYLHRPRATRNDPSLDHLVGAGEQRRLHRDAQRARRFEIDRQKHLRRKLDRQIPGSGSAQNSVYEAGASIVAPTQIDAVADKSASDDMLAISVDGRKPLLKCRH